MSAVGLDFGSLTCYIAATRTRGIETLDNEYSDRVTPCFVSFAQTRRFAGTSAQNQIITNLGNTVTGFKNLLGLKFSDPEAQEEMQMNKSTNYVALEDDEIGIRVKYLGEEHVFTPIQLSAIVLSELKATASRHIGIDVTNVVLSCPVYFDTRRRKALMVAAKVAKLNVLCLLSDTMATSLTYLLYNMSGSTEKKNVLFIDVGYSSTQVFITSFEGSKATVLSSLGSNKFGGKVVDLMIANHINEEFKEKYKIDAKTNPKAWLKLVEESSKLKKKINSSSATLPMSIECFMNDIDVNARLNRDQVESMCSDLLKNVLLNLLESVIVNSPIPITDISCVEIVGGSTRLSMVKNFVQNALKLQLLNTLNCDEAVSKGCALLCAKLTPTIQIKKFEYQDVVQYDVKAQIFLKDQLVEEIDLMKKGKQAPCTCQVTVDQKENFKVVLQQKVGNKFVDASYWLIRGVSADFSGNPQRIKFKVRCNENSTLGVTQAVMLELDEDNVENKQNETKDPEEKNEKANDAPKYKTINLAAEEISFGIFNEKVVNNYLTLEENMIKQVSCEIARSDSKNSLEDFVYKFADLLRDKWCDYVTAENAESIKSELNKLEDWLYDEGEFEKTEVYKAKLDSIKSVAAPINERFDQWEQIGPIMSELQNTISKYTAFLSAYADPKNENLKHIPVDKVKELESYVNDSINVARRAHEVVAKTPKTSSFTFSISDLVSNLKNLRSKCDPIVNTPKPMPPKPSPPQEQPETKSEESVNPDANTDPLNDTNQPQQEASVGDAPK